METQGQVWLGRIGLAAFLEAVIVCLVGALFQSHMLTAIGCILALNALLCGVLSWKTRLGKLTLLLVLILVGWGIAVYFMGATACADRSLEVEDRLEKALHILEERAAPAPGTETASDDGRAAPGHGTAAPSLP